MVLFKCSLIKRIKAIFFIYIPIWFYSNHKHFHNDYGYTPFTFQYGSIQMIFGSNGGNLMGGFTFQYGSIQI